MITLRLAFRRFRMRFLHFLQDPPLDVLGLGVISTLMGRSILFGAFATAFASAGMWFSAMTFATLVAFDVVTHAQVLVALRQLMHYEVLSEIAQPLSFEDLQGLPQVS